MSEITAGPWRYVAYPGKVPSDTHHDVVAPGWPPALDPDLFYSVLDWPTEADARLCAAAPDLLAVCQGMLECLEAGDKWNAQAQNHAADSLRTAIAKALPPRAAASEEGR